MRIVWRVLALAVGIGLPIVATTLLLSGLQYGWLMAVLGYPFIVESIGSLKAEVITATTADKRNANIALTLVLGFLCLSSVFTIVVGSVLAAWLVLAIVVAIAMAIVFWEVLQPPKQSARL
jgi:hypothetical protein